MFYTIIYLSISFLWNKVKDHRSCIVCCIPYHVFVLIKAFFVRVETLEFENRQPILEIIVLLNFLYFFLRCSFATGYGLSTGTGSVTVPDPNQDSITVPNLEQFQVMFQELNKIGSYFRIGMGSRSDPGPVWVHDMFQGR